MFAVESFDFENERYQPKKKKEKEGGEERRLKKETGFKAGENSVAVDSSSQCHAQLL